MPADTHPDRQQVSAYYDVDDLEWARACAASDDRPLGHVLRQSLKFYRQDQESANHERADRHQ